MTSVEEDGVAITDYFVSPAAGVIYAGAPGARRLFADGVRNIEVTATVGFATIPPNIVLAARELVKFWWQQGRQGSRPGFGDEVTQEQTPQGFGVPRKVMHLCKPHANRIAGFA